MDAAKHDLGAVDVDMTVPDDYPLGTYTVQGQITDLAGNQTTVTLILVVSGDRTPPDTSITSSLLTRAAAPTPASASAATDGVDFSCQLDSGCFPSAPARRITADWPTAATPSRCVPPTGG